MYREMLKGGPLYLPLRRNDPYDSSWVQFERHLPDNGYTGEDNTDSEDHVLYNDLIGGPSDLKKWRFYYNRAVFDAA